MVKLNKLGLLCVLLALFVGGCGKKKCSSKDSCKNKKVAQANIPLKDTETLLNDDISDFAFVDDEDNDKNSSAKKAEGDAKDLVAEAANEGVEVDEAPATDAERAVSGFKSVLFDFDKNSIRHDQKSVVAHDIETAKLALEQGKKVVVEGHCDQIGSASYNLALSQRRAEAVKMAMVNSGVDAENVKTVGYGYEHPIVWSDQKNRSALIKELAPNRRAEVLTN